jgi:nicotinate dehydrogenase subunit A
VRIAQASGDHFHDIMGHPSVLVGSKPDESFFNTWREISAAAGGSVREHRAHAGGLGYRWRMPGDSPGREFVMPQNIALNVNGRNQTVAVEPDSMLLYALRDALGLHGPKFGCGLAECGACTVVMDGNAIRSCVTPVSAVGSGKITTLEGLGTIERLHPLQRAFIEEQAAQCGYCINGMIMSAKALLDQKPHPSRDDIKQALDGNLCRCGTHMRIVRAIERAARQGA